MACVSALPGFCLLFVVLIEVWIEEKRMKGGKKHGEKAYWHFINFDLDPKWCEHFKAIITKLKAHLVFFTQNDMNKKYKKPADDHIVTWIIWWEYPDKIAAFFGYVNLVFNNMVSKGLV